MLFYFSTTQSHNSITLAPSWPFLLKGCWWYNECDTNQNQSNFVYSSVKLCPRSSHMLHSWTGTLNFTSIRCMQN